MRILKLRFANLNSLTGEWEIDFTHPAYADEGIFAITGATGAGKSTILDAICLALYGATPRLGDITKGKNDLMSRQTLDCFSEVIFATTAGSYRCHWSQKKAKKTGTLQSPKHEIAEYHNDDSDGKLLEEKATRTKALVENITGMDFDRFTRAMLLAQGSFSAFLQASSDERSPILEQITGTEIYSEISKKVHEMTRQAHDELKSLTDRLSGMSVLSHEEEQSLIAEKAELLAKIQQHKAQIATLEEDKRWRNNLNDYQNQVNQYNTENEQLNAQIIAFAPQKSRLQKALKALQIAGDISQLTYLQQQLSKQQTDLNQYQQALPTAQSQLQLAEQQLLEKHQRLQTSENAWQTAQPLFNQVRELDTTIHHQRGQWQEASEFSQQLQHQIAQKQADIGEQNVVLQRLNHEQQTCQTAKQNIPHAEQLAQTLAILRPLQDNLQELDGQCQTLNEEQRQLSQHQQQTEQHRQQLDEQLLQLTQQLNAQHLEQRNLEQQLNEISHGQAVGELRQQFERRWQSQNTLANAQTAVQEWQHNVSNFQQYLADSQTLDDTLISLDNALTDSEREQQHVKEKLTLLERQLQLLAKIEDLTQERDKLINGEPCPLCGATSHPYATHEPRPPSDSEQAFEQAKLNLETLNQQINALNLQKNTAHYQQQQLEQQRQQLAQRNQVLASQLHSQLNPFEPLRQLLADLIDLQTSEQSIDTPLHSFTQALQQFSTQHQHDVADLQQRLANFDQLQQQQHASQQRLSELTQRYHELESEQKLLHLNVENRQMRLGDIQHQLTILTSKQASEHQKIEQLFVPFANVQHLTNNLSLGEKITVLKNLLEQYQQLEDQLQQLSEQIHYSQHTLASLTADEQNLRQNLAQWQSKQQNLSQTLHNLTNKRQELFGEKNVENEDSRLVNAKQQAFEAWRVSEQTVQHQRHQLQDLEQQLERTQKTLAELGEQHRQSQHTVDERLTALGFADIADYHASNLPDTEREALQQQADQLNERQQQNLSLLNQAKNEIQKLLEQPRTDLPIAQIESLLAEQNQAMSEQSQLLGGINARLSDNDNLKTSQSALVNKIEQKTQHASEWKALHELIGSSDGKKFRNFAQGLTFNIMISHANEQLKKMSDRYLLLADKEQPLMLNVMDNYQGGDIRTSKNLSGGESFIISLALALGLSNMASHRMQVDSLFLDEGFGTLDDEALDVALDTLTNLQQSGKLIGVISHIQALKDRISRQIQVIPQSGGVSKIVGVGIKKLA